MERLAPVVQGTTVGLIHQPEDGEGARIIAVAARPRRRDRIAMQFVAVHESLPGPQPDNERAAVLSAV